MGIDYDVEAIGYVDVVTDFDDDEVIGYADVVIDYAYEVIDCVGEGYRYGFGFSSFSYFYYYFNDKIKRYSFIARKIYDLQATIMLFLVAMILQVTFYDLRHYQSFPYLPCDPFHQLVA